MDVEVLIVEFMFMGNTAEQVLNTVDASVLAVKPLGFESPVSSR